MKMRTSHLFSILLINLFYFFENVKADEVLGCGGFIKSHAEIDFSKVEIKLLTKQGSLKDKTDCSPSNGYYFLPIYDKGEYILKISPPPGWSFEPEQVELNFDGKSDICSQGKDLNFSFKGFGITGKVTFAGNIGNGARGVSVVLKSENDLDIRKTTTDINGIFSFTPIIPGNYRVVASHLKWYFSKSEHEVVVESGNTELPADSLVVSGFDVVGHFEVPSEQLPHGILGIALFSQIGDNRQVQCHQKTPIQRTIDNSNYKMKSACYSDVDKSGNYIFQNVPSGNYLIQVVNHENKLNLNIHPSYIEFEVLKDTYEITKNFQITGFSISGRVLISEMNSKTLSGASIKINNVSHGKTDANGIYTLKNIKPGIYKIQVDMPSFQFKMLETEIKITSESLPDIVPDAYEVCGEVVSKQSYSVGITKKGSTFHTTVTTSADTGKWCTYLTKGKYIVEVITSNVDKAKGIQFYPVQQKVEVNSTPLDSIKFSQLQAVLKGELQCLPDFLPSCTSAEVTLTSLDANGQTTLVKQSTIAEDGKYVFNNILPGPYEITIPPSKLCFESTRVLVNILSASETAPPFIQRGYEVSMISSHRIIMKYTFENMAEMAPSSTETVKLIPGVNTLCVSKYGIYKIKMEGCHQYDDSLPKTFSTADASPIMINAVAHKIGIRILSTDSDVNTLKLLIESNTKGKETIIPVSEGHKLDDKFAFRYDTYLKPKEIIHVTPLSDVLLFSPQIQEIIGSNDCINIAFTFNATRGLILRGTIVPPIPDVKIIMKFSENSELIPITTYSTIKGGFKFGPIDENLIYQLVAEKDSYVFSSFNAESASFSAHKLSEIIVVVKDEEGNGLTGVLLSLSGSESYRKNLITGDKGSINFHSLSPSQYFLRPMMKEYKFEPNSKIIDVKDGETVEIELIGKRVAYSVFGMITSLNGEPSPNINLEASSDESCMHHQEEATSEINGQYRLKGLLPGCTYTIRMKDSGTANGNVARSIPVSLTTKIEHKDVYDKNLIAISPISFVDVTARITASQNDYYKTLRIVMYPKGSSDSPIYSQRVETPLNVKARFNPGIMVFLPRIPLNGKSYVVELKSTLSDRTYSYVLPSQQFIADTSSIFFEMDFKPEVRLAENDLNQNSISALILVALVAIAFFKQDIAMDILNFIWSKINIISQELAQKQKSNLKKDVKKQEPINQREIEQMAEQINAIKRKKQPKKIS